MRAGCVCEGGGLRAAFREDLDRYVFVTQSARAHWGAIGGLPPRWEGALQQGLWATTAYRMAHYARHKARSRLLSLLSDVWRRIMVAVTQIDICADAHIGPGLWIPHGGYIIVGPVRMGRNCEIYQGVTLGNSASTIASDEPETGLRVPTLGDRVWVGPGAVVADNVTVGDDATIGANSLVVRDVPPRGVVLGLPARLISRNGSFAQVKYRGMEEDEDRAAAFAASLEKAPG